MTTTATPLATAQNGNGGPITAKQRGTTLRDLLEKKRDIIADVLPKHMTPERLIKLATVAVSRIPKLAEADVLSLMNAVIKAAELGLDCSGTLGSAYLVPFTNRKQINGRWTPIVEAQLIIGYRGLIDLARRSGQIASIEARVVWQNDLFEFEYGLDPRLKHVPAIDKEPGDFRLVYAIARLRDGAVQVEVMTKAEIDSIRERSQSGKLKDEYQNGRKTGEKCYDTHSPWHTDYPEMARKTVVKRLCKYLPLSVEVHDAIADDNAADPIDLIEGKLVPQVNDPAKRLNAKINGDVEIPAEDGIPEGQLPDGNEGDDASEQLNGESGAADTGDGQEQAAPTADTKEPDVSGADAEPLNDPLESLDTLDPDQFKAACRDNRISTMDRPTFEAIFDTHLRMVLGKFGAKAKTITGKEKRALYTAIKEGRIDGMGVIKPA